MTEEIIIDGVDVAGCEHYTTMEDCDGIHDLCEQLDDYCSIKKNCYYKQLKQAENTVNECHKYLAELEDKIERLEQENQELKELNKKICEDWEKEIKAYWNALEEIREIAKFNQFYNPEDLLINGDIGQIQDLKMTEIYNKINEVL